jgi:hypothetical protein
MTAKERDELRKQAQARNCSPYLLLPCRTEWQFLRERLGVTADTRDGAKIELNSSY